MNRLKKVGVVLVGCYLAIWVLTWLASPAITRLVLGDLLAPHQIQLDRNSSVRLNLLSSCVTIDDLIWHKNEQLAFELDELEACYSLHRLIFNEARLKRLTLTGLNTDVLLQDKTFSIAGVELGKNKDQAEQTSSTATADAPAPKGKRFGLAVAAPEVVLKDINVNLLHRDQSHELHIEQLKIVRSHYQEEVLHSELELQLTFNQAALDFSAAVDYEPLQSFGTFNIQLTDFDPAPYQYLLPESVGELAAKLNVDLNLEVKRRGDIFEIASDSSAINLQQSSYGDDAILAELESLSLELNELTSTLSIEAVEELTVDTGFTLNLDNIRVATQDGAGDLLALTNLQLEPSTLSLAGEKIFIELPELALSEMQASVRQLDADTQLEPLFQLDELTISEVQMTESAVAINDILIGEILIQAQRDEQGELISLVMPGTSEDAAASDTDTAEVDSNTPSQPEPQSPSQSTPQPPQEPVEPANAFAIALGQLRLDKPAQIQFRDASIKPALEKTFTIEQLQLAGIDNQQPEQRADVILKLKDEGYFKFDFTGQVAPFGDKLDLNFESTATEFPLYQISPYVRHALGFDVLAGQLDVSASGAIEQDMLDAEVVSNLRGARFDSGSGDQNPDDSGVIGQTAVPLDMALGMLKDDDGNIELIIPVDGDVADPSFGMHYIFGLIVQKAVLSQAQNYLIMTFMPYAQVIKVGMAAGSFALKVRFDDLAYAPQQILPAEPQATFIDQFHALMTEKDSLQVKVCGVATGSELGFSEGSQLTEPQRKQLLDLAEQRANAFKKAVVDKGVASSRILLCVPSYELDDTAQPRLKLSV
ncbi:DUF748 domain-containing protein [Neiella marina]|uniref:DUF748 domain-containing protein n=1 Tax=Neiella holothuriorum TaxID=2870530 RepID=A0ABS7EFU5_9GAMM|nr:DUF748 domain-containing protein [Neiella holothuriorum]MBW8191130.1 DUF748 domain-containing protein [Neiella holothuriorum]